MSPATEIYQPDFQVLLFRMKQTLQGIIDNFVFLTLQRKIDKVFISYHIF